MMTNIYQDLAIVVIGAVAWTLAIVPVQLAGKACAGDDSVAKNDDNKGGKLIKTSSSSSSSSSLAFNKGVCLVIGVALAAVTTPVLSSVCGWHTPHERVRGVAIALGTAQTMDGIMHIYHPTFYSKNPNVAIAGAGNIFLGAGLLGILSAYM
jgi:hypothetical protein